MLFAGLLSPQGTFISALKWVSHAMMLAKLGAAEGRGGYIHLHVPKVPATVSGTWRGGPTDIFQNLKESV